MADCLVAKDRYEIIFPLHYYTREDTQFSSFVVLKWSLLYKAVFIIVRETIF